MSSRRICLSLLIVVCSLLVNCGTTKGPHSSNLTPPTAYFFGLEDQKAVYGVGALNDIGPDRDDAHFSTLTIRFIGPDSGKWAIQVMIDGYRLREWPNKHPQSCGPVVLEKPLNCKLLTGKRHYFAIDRGFAGDLRVPGTDGYVPVDMFRSMALGFQVRQGCRYEARLSADTQPALNKMPRWRESGKYRVYESIGKAHAGIYEIDGAGRETKVAGGDANLSAK